MDNQLGAVGNPQPANVPNQDDTLVRARLRESLAYQSLITDGGRPSHPLGLLEDIVARPGRYRDILAFWQDRSDEWQVFSKQLSRWRTFLSHQKGSREVNRFPSYVEDLTARLQRHGFVLPASFNQPPSGFSRYLDRQDKLATWVEYLNYEFTRRDEYDKWLETCRPGYDEALAQLMKAQVLQPFESVRTPTSDLCRPSSIEVTKRKHERRSAEIVYQAAKRKAHTMDICEVPCQPQLEGDISLEEAEKQLNTANKRAFCIADFTRKTHAYRFALDRSERHELLLRWVLDQIPVIEKEMGQSGESAAKGAGEYELNGQDAPPSFRRFQHLPPEIRLKIWRECFPRQPSVHFFEVLNQQRKRHLAHSWSSKEFRVRATTARDSGYLAVYNLLAACRESRLAVAGHYGRKSVEIPKSCPHNRAAESSSRLPDFRKFDWIPAEDLIVLCFPPIQVPQLPARNAFTLGHESGAPRRRIGVLVPQELLVMSQSYSLTDDVESENDAAQVSLIPSFIDGLHKPTHHTSMRDQMRRGIKKLYLIVEGWSINHEILQGTFGIDSTKDVSTWSESRGFWHLDSPIQADTPTVERYFSASSWPEEDEVPLPKKGPWRQLWWLGGGRKAVASYELEDFLEKVPVRRISDFLQVLETECDQMRWHPDFEGVESLGWMEPATERMLDRRPLDVAQVLQVKLGEHLDEHDLDAVSELP